jgi:acyl-coenzyme A synthetase/AMP-(fatty) acid ligase/acyl carrier protein
LGITCIYVVPSLLRQFVDSGPQVVGSLRKLRVVTAGGETLALDLAVRFRELFPNTRLINTYGSNEIGTMAAMRVIGDGDEADSRAIGKAVVNTQIYVLDPDMQPVPPGTTGEIHVGSMHLARGYVGNPALTAERFLPDPFATRGGARLYRTGDLGRVDVDGSIEFLGRGDNQVKIRGFRIELDEIRIALETHDQVAEAALRAWEAPNAPRLVAYVVPRDETRLGSSELRRHLEERLPDYMIPASFVELPALPRTFNGKIAVTQLPPPPGMRPDIETAYAPPESDAERTIVEIWEELLEVRPVGIHDNFIELGGDSLLAVQAGAQISEAFGPEIPIEVMLDGTVSEIAEHVQSSINPEEES